MFSEKNEIKRKIHSFKDSIYDHRFIYNLSSGYSLMLKKKGDDRDFFSFEPQECMINTLLKGYHQHDSFKIEQIINKVTYSLMIYGRAYIYICPKYSIKKDDETETKVLDFFEIGCIDGKIKKKTREGYFFCRNIFNMNVKEIYIPKKQLILFDIRDIGFSKRYFSNILKKLSKCDIISSSTDMLINHSDVYDYDYHSKRIKIAELKASRNIGGLFDDDCLSSSYIMYKRIQADKLKIRFLEYIIKKINEGLQEFLGENAGELVAHINKKDYTLLWKNYSEGKITGTELNNILSNR